VDAAINHTHVTSNQTFCLSIAIAVAVTSAAFGHTEFIEPQGRTWLSLGLTSDIYLRETK